MANSNTMPGPGQMQSSGKCVQFAPEREVVQLDFNEPTTSTPVGMDRVVDDKILSTPASASNQNGLFSVSLISSLA